MTSPITLTRVKVITSYAGYARWLAEMAESDWNIGTIPRQEQIPSPYAYSPTHSVMRWNGMPVILVETRSNRPSATRTWTIPHRWTPGSARCAWADAP